MLFEAIGAIFDQATAGSKKHPMSVVVWWLVTGLVFYTVHVARAPALLAASVSIAYTVYCMMLFSTWRQSYLESQKVKVPVPPPTDRPGG